MIVINHKYNNEGINNSLAGLGGPVKDPMVSNLPELVRSFNELLKKSDEFVPISLEEFRDILRSHPDKGKGEIDPQYKKFSALVDEPIFSTELAMEFLALFRSLI